MAIAAIAEIARVLAADECCPSSLEPCSAIAEAGASTTLRLTDEAIGFRSRDGCGDLLTEDRPGRTPTPSPGFDRHPRRRRPLCVADTVGHAVPSGAAAVVRFIATVVEECGGGVGIDWHGHRDRDLAMANSLAAIESGATRIHGAAIGIGERVGNTPMEALLVNLVLMGYFERDLGALVEYCAAVSAATGVPSPQLPIVAAMVPHPPAFTPPRDQGFRSDLELVTRCTRHPGAHGRAA